MERAEDRLALIEWIGTDRRVVRSADVMRWPVTVGRGLHNTLVLDDPAVAASHAHLELDDHGQPRVVAGSSRNGVVAGGHVLQPGQSFTWPQGTERLLRLGDTTLRLRCADDPLPEEAATSANAWRPPTAAAVVMLLAWLGLLAAAFWIRLDPGSPVTAWLPLLAAPLGLVLWCLLWGLASKVFRHHFDVRGHFAVAAPALLAIALLDALGPQVAASLGWPVIAETATWLSWFIAALWLRQHLLITLPHPGPRATRVLDRTVSTCAVLLAVAYLGVHHGQTQRWRGDLYLGTLPMPQLWLGRAVPVEPFIDSTTRLQRRLDARAAAARNEDGDDDDSGDAGDGS